MSGWIFKQNINKLEPDNNLIIALLKKCHPYENGQCLLSYNMQICNQHFLTKIGKSGDFLQLGKCPTGFSICPILGTSWWGGWQGSSWGDWSPSTLGRRRVGFTPDMESVWMKGQQPSTLVGRRKVGISRTRWDQMSSSYKSLVHPTIAVGIWLEGRVNRRS